jgi:hypothetical protein
LLKHSLHLVAVANVTSNRQSLTTLFAKLAFGFQQLAFGSRTDGNAGPRVNQLPGQNEAESARPAGDQDGLAVVREVTRAPQKPPR